MFAIARLGVPLFALTFAVAGCSSSGGGGDTTADSHTPSVDTTEDDTGAVDTSAGDTAASTGLSVTAGAAGGTTVSGSYRDGAVVVRVEASADGAGAVASLHDGDDTLLVTARVLGATGALRAFAATDEARAFARGLLGLGCVVNAEETAPARAAPTSPPPDPIRCAGASFAGCCGFLP